MSDKTKDEILHDHNHDGIDRRGFLKCMAWAGTGAFCVMQGGVLKSYSMSQMGDMKAEDMKGELSFAQISDSHVGFNKAANTDRCDLFSAWFVRSSQLLLDRLRAVAKNVEAGDNDKHLVPRRSADRG